MHRYLLPVLLLLPATASAQHPLELASDAAIVADVGTTIHALRRDPLFVETNPLMPARPTTGTVLFWGGVALAANEGLTRLLFRPSQRPYVWAAVAVVELLMVRHNARALGIRLAF